MSPKSVVSVVEVHTAAVTQVVQRVVDLSEGQSACQSVRVQDSEPRIGPSVLALSLNAPDTCVWLCV